jgi:hypothetical protein
MNIVNIFRVNKPYGPKETVKSFQTKYSCSGLAKYILCSLNRINREWKENVVSKELESICFSTILI